MDRFDYNKPNTRERLAARRKHMPRRRHGSVVLPGPKRALSAWLVSGRVISLVLFAASVAALGYVFTTPAFAVRDVQVQGAQVLKRDDVLALAGGRGQSIWFVDTAAIAERLKQSAYVEQAAAFVSLPDHLTLVVQERRPELRWQSNGTRYLVDGSGRVLGIDGTATLTDALVIDDQSKQTLKPNDRVDADALALGRALSLRLPDELGVTPNTISWNLIDGISVATADGHAIVFGHNDRLDEKLMILQALLRTKTPFTFLDLRSSTPYYRDASKQSEDITPTPSS